MAEIINYQPQNNPRLQQIYEVLLLAGYFRIRISSLKAFDKIIGGIAWCITSSNFQIQLQYNDEMQIGQKIKVSQQICTALKNMKCPYNLQPFQLQGLDVNNIFPVVQWLIKFVYETRFQRQKYNRQIALIQGKSIVDFGTYGNKNIINQIPIKRQKINKAVMQTSHMNPIRVYSCLLEFNDMTSLRMYNKLHNMMLNKKQRKKIGSYNSYDTNNNNINNINQQKQQQINQNDFLNIMNPDKEKDQNQETVYFENNKNFQQHFTNTIGSKISLQKLQKIIQQNKQNYEIALKQSQQDNSHAQENILNKFKQQSVHYEQQIKVIQSQIQSYQNVLQKNKEQYQKMKIKKQQYQEKLNSRKQKYIEIQQYGKQIEQELKTQKITIKQQGNMEQLVQKKMKLKEKKNQIKKKAKIKLQQLQQKKQAVQTSIPQIDQQVFNHMLQQAQMKKQIYDRKYAQLTKVNQQIAILQRKAQNYTSAPQIAQYHQRFVQLFQSINILIQQKRNIYQQMNNLQSIQKLGNNYKQFLLNAKQGINNAKNKTHKKQLTQDLKQIFMGFEKNMNNSKLSLNKLENNLEKTYNDYSDLVKIEREYMKKLRELKIQYENVEKDIK